MTTISNVELKLSRGSLTHIVKQLKDYKNDIDKKSDVLVARATEFCKEELQRNINSLGENQLDGNDKGIVESTSNQENGVVSLNGDQVSFIEFGTGLKYGDGSYPGEKPDTYVYGAGEKIKEDGHWRYFNGEEYVKTFGMPAQAPVFKAAKTTAKNIPKIAKEVFKEELLDDEEY